MPGNDRTGPMGQGAGTGRGLGPCGPERPETGQGGWVPRLMQRVRRRRCRRDTGDPPAGGGGPKVAGNTGWTGWGGGRGTGGARGGGRR